MDYTKEKQLSIIRAVNSIFFLFLLLNHWSCAQDDLSSSSSSQQQANQFLDKKIDLAQNLFSLQSEIPTLTPTDEQVLWQVKGEVLYNDRLYDETGYEGLHTVRSVPYTQVEIFQKVKRSNGEIEIELLDQVYTNSQGYFRLNWQAQKLENTNHIQDFLLRVYSIQRTPTGHNVVVRSSNQSMPYQLEVEIELEQFSLQSKTQQPWLPEEIVSPNFVSIVAVKEGHLSGAFNILNATAVGFEQISKHSDQLGPTLSFTWDLDQAVSCGSCYSNNRIRLGGQVEDPDHYDDHIILHEMGHFFTDRWSVDDSPGGPHRGRAVHPSLAYGEGLAYFWSALVLQDPMIVDWMFPEPWVVDLEQNLFNGLPMTWGTFAPVASTSDLVAVSALHHEELVSSLLWAIYQLFLSDDAEWAEGLIMSSLIDELPARIDSGSDVGAIGIDFADLLDSLICTLADDSTLNSWLEHIENFSRLRSYSWYWFNSREELCSQKGTQTSLKISFTPSQSSQLQTIDTLPGTLIVEALNHVNDQFTQQELSYQVWLGAPPNSQIIARGKCKNLPCNLALHPIIEQSTLLKEQLIKDHRQNQDPTHFDLHQLSVPLMITLVPEQISSKALYNSVWRGSWLSNTYIKKQRQKLSIQEYQSIFESSPQQAKFIEQPSTVLSEKGQITYH